MNLSLIHFMPLLTFDTPGKHQKTRDFLMFSAVSKGISGMKWLKKEYIVVHQTLCCDSTHTFLEHLYMALSLQSNSMYMNMTVLLYLFPFFQPET